jgi:hypothetical protein
MDDSPIALMVLGSYRNGYYCPFCKEHIDTPIGIDCTPVVDCSACDGVGVLTHDPFKEKRNRVEVEEIQVKLRPVKSVRVDSDSEFGYSQAGLQATFEPPVYNITPAARLQGINVTAHCVIWITTVDDVEHGYHYAW